MSSRQLRKLQQQREAEQAKLQAQQGEQVEESEEEPTLPTKSKASLFVNLAFLGVEDEEEDEPAENKEVPVDDDESDHDPAPTSVSKKPKKPKKKKKKAAKGKEVSLEKDASANDTDDIDAALRELNIKQNSGGGPTKDTAVKVDPEYQRVCTLLGINSQHLKVAHEMRNLFGKGITDTHEDEPDPARRGGRRRRVQQQNVDLETALKGNHPKGKGLPELTLRRNPFIQGKDDWPKSSAGGLTMEMVDNKAADGTIEFKYAYDQSYVTVQRAFRQAVELGDPQNMIYLLKQNPYNVSLLLVVSKIAKNQGDHALSADLLERALFTFGRVATTLFNTKLAQGKARVDFARPENRELWLAGYHYIKALLMKGTYRTALEWAKLMLSLDPEGDPYCMRLIVHNLAIRGHEFQYLQDLYGSKLPEIWSPSNLSQNSLSHTRPSLAYAAMQTKDSALCRALLSKSMQETPWLFNRLFQEISLDPPATIWGIMPRTDAETLFTEIYVLQTKDLWNTPAATALLMEIAHTIPKVDAKSIPKLDNKEMTLDVVRYVYVDDNPAIMKYAPSALLHRSHNSDFDPLPPDNNLFSSYSVRDHHGGEEQTRFGLGNDMNNPMAALMALMQRNGAGLQPQGPDQPFVEEADGSDHLAEGNEDDEDDDVLPPDLGVGGARIPSSIARRVLDMLWGTRAIAEESESEEGEWETSDEMQGSVEPDDAEQEEDEEMPALVDDSGRPIHRDQEEDEEDMPALVPL